MLGDPVFYALAGALLEGYAEGAVAAVAAACLPEGPLADPILLLMSNMKKTKSRSLG